MGSWDQQKIKVISRRWVTPSVLSGLILLIVISLPNCRKDESPQSLSPPDLSQHPIYSRYAFDKQENVINIGVQPLYFPTGLISEAMKRDAILRRDLVSLGMKVRFFPFLKGSDVNFFLRKGDLVAGIGGDMPAITAAANLDLKIASLIQLGFTSIVANQYLQIRDLKGKRIGYAWGSNAHYALMNALAGDGLSTGEVDLISMEVTEMPEALQDGRIDAYSAWEPILGRALEKDPESVVIHRGYSSGYLYFSKGFSDRHPEAVRRIVAAEMRAIRWIRSNRSNLLTAIKWSSLAGEKLSGRAVELSDAKFAAMAEKDILGLSSAPLIPESDLRQGGTLQREFEFLKNLGKIPSSIHWERVKMSFDLHILRDLISGSEEYRLDEFEYEAYGESEK